MSRHTATGRNRQPTSPPSSASREKGGSRFSFSRWLGNHQEVAAESLSRLFGAFFSSLMSWVVIGIALALPLGLFLFVFNLQTLGDDVGSSARISLYLQMPVDESQLRDVMVGLDSRQDVEAVTYISAEQGLEDFRTATGNDEVLAGLEQNPLPAVIQVTPVSLAPDTVQALVDELSALPVVESTVLDMEWVQRLNAILGFIQRLTFGLAILLCIGVVLVIGNTVRMAIENRRAEITVVKLVGGTNAWVARPFLYSGFWYGVGGGVIAVLLITLGLFLLQGSVSQLAGLYDEAWKLTGWDISIAVTVLAGSGFIGWFGAWISVVRHLKSIEPR